MKKSYLLVLLLSLWVGYKLRRRGLFARLFDLVLYHHKVSLTSCSHEDFMKEYGHDKKLLDASIELLAFRKTIKMVADQKNPMWMVHQIASRLTIMTGTGRELCSRVQTKNASCLWIKHPSLPESPRCVMLFFHGGGYLFGTAEAYRGFLGRISREMQIPTLSVDYRLVKPGKITVKDCVDDCVDAYHYLLSEGFLPKDIVLCGDSAGGGLVLSVLQRLKKANLDMPLCGVCIAPFCDPSLTSSSCIENEDHDLILQPHMKHLTREGLKKAHEDFDTNPEIMVLNTSFKGFPPLYISACEKEVLFDDAVKATNHAKSAGVDVQFDIYLGYRFHIEPCFANVYPEASAALTQMCQYIEKQIENRPSKK